MAESDSPYELTQEVVVDLAAAAGEAATLPEVHQQLDIPESPSSYESAQEVVVDLVTAAGEATLPEVHLQLDIPESPSSYESAQEALVDLAAAGEADLQLDISESSSSYESAQEALIDLAAAGEATLPEGGQTVDASMKQDDRNGSSGSGRVAAVWSFCQHPGPMHARYIYAALYLIGDVSAWVLRENPKALFKVQRHSGCHGDRDCLASEAVLMISFANFLFFSLMGISTLFTRTMNELRSSWHSGWWPLKMLILLGCYVSPILVPDDFVELYGRVSPFGAGLFLFIQLISVIRYITRLNSKWCGQENFDTHRRKVNRISKLAYGCSMVGIILMVLFYVGSRPLTVWLIGATLALVYIMPPISSLTKAKGFYMEPLLMGIYIVFLCWSAIKSEPWEENTGSGVNWKTMISFIGALAGIVVNAFSTGTYYKCIQFTNVVPSGNAVPYGYGFFHFIFATGSMNFGMMYLGWDTHHALGKWSMDVGWTSAIVHIVNEGLAAVFFVMVILARFYGIGRLQQLLGNGIGGQQQQQQLVDESRHAIELPTFSTDNIGLPRESLITTRREGTETINDESPRPREQTRITEPAVAETKRDKQVQAPSSSSTTGPHRPPYIRAPSPPVIGRQWGEITELWPS